mgnify:CR=1 FL=1
MATRNLFLIFLKLIYPLDCIQKTIALLFEKTENVVEIIKWKEIYEHLETTLDYCENVSNIIKGITVKYV